MVPRPIIERLRKLGASEPLADEAANVIGDLLVALEVVEGRLENDDDSGGAIEARRIVRDAIAKARGRAK